MNAANQRQLRPLLVALAVALAAALLLLLSGVGQGVRWDAPRAAAALPPAGNPADLPQPVPLQQFALVWQKPLFSPDRKPMARTVDGGSSMGDLELTGIILTRDLRMALLRDKKGDKQVRLREGQALPDGSVTLMEIRPRSALFESAGSRTELKLPAGAPIDPGTARAASAVPGGADAAKPEPGQEPAPGNHRGMVAPLPPPQQQPASAASADTPEERLRQSIQKRRAAAAAAAAAANQRVR